MEKSLYDVFAEKWYRGGSIWFISDPHFKDEESKEFRTARGLYKDDETALKLINSKLGKKDTIVILGDIGDIEFVKKIRGYKVLVLGNHDTGATNYKRVIEEVETFDSSKIPEMELKYLQELFLAGDPKYQTEANRIYEKYHRKEIRDNHLFDEVYEGPVMIGPKLILSHEPFDFPYALNIHGHDHSGRNFHDDMHINVCAELIGYTPISIKEIINSGKLKNVIDIHREAIDKQAKDSLKRKNK